MTATMTQTFVLKNKRNETLDFFPTLEEAVAERNTYPMLERVRVVKVTEEVVA